MEVTREELESLIAEALLSDKIARFGEAPLWRDGGRGDEPGGLALRCSGLWPGAGRLGAGGRSRVLDLFAGCSGLSIGFRAAGFAIVATVEFDPGRSFARCQLHHPRHACDARLVERAFSLGRLRVGGGHAFRRQAARAPSSLNTKRRPSGTITRPEQSLQQSRSSLGRAEALVEEVA